MSFRYLKKLVSTPPKHTGLFYVFSFVPVLPIGARRSFVVVAVVVVVVVVCFPVIILFASCLVPGHYQVARSQVIMD